MAPKINVSEETLQGLDKLGVSYTKMEDHENFIYVPSINLHVAKQRSHLNKNWFESHKELQNRGERMLTVPEFIEVLKYTNENHQDIYNDITEVKSPWRAEWLDADFKMKEGKLYINSNHIYQNGVLVPQTSEVLHVDTLMKNKVPGISLEDYLQNPTKQRFPTEKTKSGNLFYWAPISDDDSVAVFDADVLRAGLDCRRSPSNRDSLLGVRAAKQ